MNSSLVLSVTTFVYGLAAFLYLAAWVFQKDALNRSATWLAAIGVAGNIGGLVLRWLESYRMGIGHAPLSNLYESLVFFALMIAVLCLLMERQIQPPDDRRVRHAAGLSVHGLCLAVAQRQRPHPAAACPPSRATG
ncbi:MAG: hypothetical protein MZV70_02385 [Desulfobacterales bacterium]|nr:hypothetical protein [Desulfobacterales bacterium]